MTSLMTDAQIRELLGRIYNAIELMDYHHSQGDLRCLREQALIASNLLEEVHYNLKHNTSLYAIVSDIVLAFGVADFKPEDLGTGVFSRYELLSVYYLHFMTWKSMQTHNLSTNSQDTERRHASQSWVGCMNAYAAMLKTLAATAKTEEG